MKREWKNGSHALLIKRGPEVSQAFNQRLEKGDYKRAFLQAQERRQRLGG